MSSELKTDGKFYYQTETHYDQLDGQMLLHHPRYMIFVERAQQLFFESVLNAPRFDWRNFPDMYIVVRKFEIEFLRPIEGVQDIQVVLWPEMVRAAKMKTAFELRSADGSSVFAKGYRLNCKVDQQTHQPVMWTDSFIDGIQRLIDSAS